MATLEDIATTLAANTAAINALPANVAAAVVAALPPQSTVDTTAIESAITNGFAALTAEIKTNVEGAAPAPARGSAASPARGTGPSARSPPPAGW